MKRLLERLRDNPYAPLGFLLLVAAAVYLVLLLKGCEA